MYRLPHIQCGGNCSLCGAPNVNKLTCPLNPGAKNPKHGSHRTALCTATVGAAAAIAKVKAPKLPSGDVGMRTKQWEAHRKPKTREQRQLVMQRCGEKCFLAEDYKYPVCSYGDGDPDCSYDCDGLRAERNQAAIIKNRTSVSMAAIERARSAAAKAEELGIKYCGWVRED